MQIVNKKLSELKPYEKNPRKNDTAVEYVAESIRQFGWKVPIVIDRENIIIAGHTRYKAAKKLHIEEVPCIVADDLTDEQVKAYRLADNKVSEYAEWDMALLDEELAGIFDLDMTAFGFELPDAFGDDRELQEDEAPEPPKVAKSKPGEVYQLGRHILMCGDSTRREDVERLMDGAKADLLLTDPPYNVDYTGKNPDSMKIANDNMASGEFYDFLSKCFVNASAAMSEGAAFYVWYASTEVVNFKTSIEAAGLMVKQELIWNKNSFVLGRQDYQWKHESCLYGWKGGKSHSWYGDRKQSTVIDWTKPAKADLHPTMKPVGLFDYEIRNSTKAGDTVLDLFGGSGTTLIACEQNGRKARLMEYDAKYVDVIIERWEDLTGGKAVLIDG